MLGFIHRVVNNLQAVYTGIFATCDIRNQLILHAFEHRDSTAQLEYNIGILNKN
jgi:hypothetical protein